MDVPLETSTSLRTVTEVVPTPQQTEQAKKGSEEPNIIGSSAVTAVEEWGIPTESELLKMKKTLIYVVAAVLFRDFSSTANDIVVDCRVSWPEDGPVTEENVVHTLIYLLGTSGGEDVWSGKAIHIIICLFERFNLGVWFEYNGYFYGFNNAEHIGAEPDTVHFKLTEELSVLYVSRSIPSSIASDKIAFTIITSPEEGVQSEGTFSRFPETLMI